MVRFIKFPSQYRYERTIVIFSFLQATQGGHPSLWANIEPNNSGPSVGLTANGGSLELADYASSTTVAGDICELP